MTIAQSKIQLAQKVLQTDDRHILKAIEALFNQEEDTNLSSAQKKELDKRLADHKAGKLKYYTMGEVKKAVHKAIKK
jgi:putative addiction module component (TIGR02574 family)